MPSNLTSTAHAPSSSTAGRPLLSSIGSRNPGSDSRVASGRDISTSRLRAPRRAAMPHPSSQRPNQAVRSAHALCEHAFDVSIRGNPYRWLQGALARGDLSGVRAAAAELEHRVNLTDSLAIVLLM